MKSYIGYVLNVTRPEAPAVTRVFLRAAEYDLAWKMGRGALDSDKRERPVKDKAGNTRADHRALLFIDAECSKPFPSHGDAFTFVRCDDATPRNVKIDMAALRAVLADNKASDADKLAATKKLAGIA